LGKCHDLFDPADVLMEMEMGKIKDRSAKTTRLSASFFNKDQTMEGIPVAYSSTPAICTTTGCPRQLSPA
jgi:hypothetical protein